MAKTTGKTGGSGYGKKMLALSKTAKKSRKSGKLMVGLWDQLAAQAEDKAERKRNKMMSDDLKQARKRKDRAATPKSIRRPTTANEKADEYRRKKLQLKEDMRLFLRGSVKHSTARLKARRKRADDIVGIVTSKKIKTKIPKSLRKNK